LASLIAQAPIKIDGKNMAITFRKIEETPFDGLRKRWFCILNLPRAAFVGSPARG
jgi:hypothetical protein